MTATFRAADRTWRENALPVTGPEDVITARQRVKMFGRGLGFDSFDLTRIMTATSEVARAFIRYAGNGEFQVRALEEPLPFRLVIIATCPDPTFSGLDVPALDWRGSHDDLLATLSRVRNLADDLQIDDRPSLETRTRIILQYRLRDRV